MVVVFHRKSEIPKEKHKKDSLVIITKKKRFVIAFLYINPKKADIRNDVECMREFQYSKDKGFNVEWIV